MLRFARPGLALLGIGLLGVAAGALCAQEPAKTPAGGAVSYYRDVRPIFQTHCQGCHQPAKKSGNYLMTAHAELLKTGESDEKAIVPGKPDASYLVKQITPDAEGKAAMPQGKPPLSSAERDTIARWIAGGASDDTPASAAPKYDMEHPPQYPLPPIITSLSFSSDGQFLAVSGYHEVLVHKADGSELVARLVGLSERIEKATFSPDGKLIAVAGGSPGRLGELQIWRTESWKLRFSQAVTFDTIYGASWSPDQKYVAFGCADNTVRGVDIENGQQVFFNGAHEDWVQDTVFSVDGKHIISVSRDRAMKLYEFDTQRFVDNITSITPGALKGGLRAVTRHPTKDELLCGGADGQPKIYKMIRTQARQIGDDFNKIRDFPALPGRVFDVAYSRDGGRIVAGASNNGVGEVRVYNSDNAQQISKMEDVGGPVYAVDFNHDGTVVATGGFDGYVRLFDAATGKLIKKFSPAPLMTTP